MYTKSFGKAGWINGIGSETLDAQIVIDPANIQSLQASVRWSASMHLLR